MSFIYKLVQWQQIFHQFCSELLHTEGPQWFGANGKKVVITKKSRTIRIKKTETSAIDVRVLKNTQLITRKDTRKRSAESTALPTTTLRTQKFALQLNSSPNSIDFHYSASAWTKGNLEQS